MFRMVHHIAIVGFRENGIALLYDNSFNVHFRLLKFYFLVRLHIPCD